MSGFLIIAGPGASAGFRCAGLETMEADESTDVSALLMEVMASGRHGLVAIEDRLYSRVSESVLRRVRKKGLPIIVPVNVPGSWAEVGFGESPIMRLIRRAIGYQIKLKR